jgi:hypothetical protein
MPVPKVPAYGDANRLTQLASGLKREHGTYGAVVQRNDVGRPTGSGQQQAPEAAIPGEHMQSARAIAQAEWVNQFWSNMAQKYPDSPLIEMYAANAARIAGEKAQAFQQATPFFEW